MKIKEVLTGLIVILSIFILLKLIPNTKTAGTVNYAPDGFKKTIETNIDGVVTETSQEGLLWVTINRQKLPFSYDVYQVPKEKREYYPEHFIQIGDSIFKNANSDTFYLIRGNKKWQYFLPK